MSCQVPFRSKAARERASERVNEQRKMSYRIGFSLFSYYLSFPFLTQYGYSMYAHSEASYVFFLNFILTITSFYCTAVAIAIPYPLLGIDAKNMYALVLVLSLV